MKARLAFLLLGTLALASCGRSIKAIPIQELRFQSIFASYPQHKNEEYCLENTGFFRAPITENADSIIQGWIRQHPGAIAIPVATIDRDMSSTFTFCWVIAGQDTLNNELVRKGCIPGSTMLGRSDRIDEKDYRKFIDQIKEAESQAQAGKRGIWNRPDSLNTVE